MNILNMSGRIRCFGKVSSLGWLVMWCYVIFVVFGKVKKIFSWFGNKIIV